jgi:hypothetical protein
MFVLKSPQVRHGATWSIFVILSYFFTSQPSLPARFDLVRFCEIGFCVKKPTPFYCRLFHFDAGNINKFYL